MHKARLFATSLAMYLALACAGASFSFAQTAFPTADGRTAANGAVNMCLNAAGVAAPCSPSGPYPFGATAITAASGNVAAATATATLAAVAGKTTYICGFVVTSTGSTAAAVVSPTVANTITGTLTFTYASVAGATAANANLIVPMMPCVPASAVNTTIVVSVPSLGAGNTNTTVNAWGYQL
jgi:hypothetical protein